MFQTISQPDFALRILLQHTMHLPTMQTPAELFFAPIKEQSQGESPMQNVFHHVQNTQYLTQMKTENNILNIKLSLNFLGAVLEKSIRELGASRGQPLLQTPEHQPAPEGKLPQAVQPSRLLQPLQGAGLLHRQEPQKQPKEQENPPLALSHLAKEEPFSQQIVHTTKPAAAQNKGTAPASKAIMIPQQRHAPEASAKAKSLLLPTIKTEPASIISRTVQMQNPAAYHADFAAEKAVFLSRQGGKAEAPTVRKSPQHPPENAAMASTFLSQPALENASLLQAPPARQESRSSGSSPHEQSKQAATTSFNEGLHLAHFTVGNALHPLPATPNPHTMPIMASKPKVLPVPNSPVEKRERAEPKAKRLHLSSFPLAATPLMHQTVREKEAAGLPDKPLGRKISLAHASAEIEGAAPPTARKNAAPTHKEIPVDWGKQTHQLGTPKPVPLPQGVHPPQHGATLTLPKPAVLQGEKSAHGPLELKNHTTSLHAKQSSSIVLPQQFAGRVSQAGQNDSIVAQHPVGNANRFGIDNRHVLSPNSSWAYAPQVGQNNPQREERFTPLGSKQLGVASVPMPLQQHSPSFATSAPATVVYRKEVPQKPSSSPPAQSVSEDIAFIKKTIQKPMQTISEAKVNTAVNTSATATPPPVAALNLEQQVNAIVDKVYSALERRLRSERMRKGML